MNDFVRTESHMSLLFSVFSSHKLVVHNKYASELFSLFKIFRGEYYLSLYERLRLLSLLGKLS